MTSGASGSARSRPMNRPGDLGGSDPWQDAESCRHGGSTPMSCASARSRWSWRSGARGGKGHDKLARVGRQLGLHPAALRGRVKRPRSMAGCDRVPVPVTRPGSPSWNAKIVSCGAREILKARRVRISRGNSTPGFRASRVHRFASRPVRGGAGVRGPGIPRSTYYAAKKRGREPSQRQWRDEWLKSRSCSSCGYGRTGR